MSPDGTWIVSASDDHTLKSGMPPPAPNGPPSPATPAQVLGCAVSPDGAWIVSASDDDTLRIWDAATGAERAVLVLPGGATAVAFHPSAPMVVCGDAGGGVHLAHLVGIDLGPLVVTAAAHDSELTVRCPACQHRFQIEKEQLGQRDHLSARRLQHPAEGQSVCYSTTHRLSFRPMPVSQQPRLYQHRRL